MKQPNRSYRRVLFVVLGAAIVGLIAINWIQEHQKAAESVIYLRGLTASAEGAVIHVSNAGKDTWMQLTLAVTERSSMPSIERFETKIEKLEPGDSIRIQLADFADYSGKRFNWVELKPRLLAVWAHVVGQGDGTVEFQFR